MSKEYEAKFLEVDVSKIREKLIKLGAKQVHEKKRYVRMVFHRCSGNIKGYARIRDEAGITTMTVKLYKDPRFPEEYEITIKNTFEQGVAFLESLELKKKAFQETYREKWSHPLVHEITFDDVPGLPTYMEIDCTGEENLHKMIELLDLDKSKMRFGAFDATYNEYYDIPKPEINDNTPSLTFANIINEIKPRKNMELLEKLQKEYLKEFSKAELKRSLSLSTTIMKVNKKKTAVKKTSKKSSKKSSKKDTKKESKKTNKKSSKKGNK
jgi:hypothetical protein